MAAINFILLLNAFDLDEQRHLLRINRRHLRDVSDPLTIPDNIFKGLYRLSKETAHFLIVTLGPSLRDSVKENISVPKTLKVMVALHFYAQGSYQKGCGQDTNFPMSQSVVSNCIREVTTVINNDMAYLIHFPNTPEEKNAEKIAFNILPQGFPGIIGAIDCTHVAIIAPPTMDPNYPGILYLNRKGFYSINTQIVCNARLKILAINARYPGSVHDSAIWTTSQIRHHLRENFNDGDQASWLLGDSGYPLEPWLMTPILGRNLNPEELRFNNAHRSIRNVIERLNGTLKGRFRCLLKHRTLHYDPVMAGKIINACAILHNLCLERHDIIDENYIDLNPVEDIFANLNPVGQENHGNVARQIRIQIVNNYF